MASTVDQIAIKLGIQTGDLKAALKDAGADIKNFKKAGESTEDEGLLGQFKNIKHSLRDLHTLLVAGGIATAVKNFFAIAIDAANNSTDAIDENVRAVKDFGKEVADAKGLFASFAILVIGTFNRLGEAIGDYINILTTGPEQWAREQDAIAATASQAEEAEKRFAELKRKHGAEFESITKKLADVEAKAAEQKLKSLTVYEQQEILQKRLAELVAQQAKGEGATIDQRRVALKIAETQLALDENALAVKKEQTNEAERQAKEWGDAFKQTAEDMKDEAEAAKKLAALKRDEAQKTADVNVEIAKILLKGEENLTAEDKERLKLLRGQTTEQKQAAEIALLLAKGVENLTDLEKERLRVLVGGVQVLKDQHAEVVAIVDEAKKLQGIVTNKGDVRELTDVQLAALKNKLSGQLADAQIRDRQVGGVGGRVGSYSSVEQAIFQTGLNAVEKELAARRDVSRAVSFFGESRASTMFAPDEFSRLLQTLNPDQAKKQASDISLLAGTVARVFPAAATNTR